MRDRVLIMPSVRIPSIRAAAAGARRVSVRFPFVLLAAIGSAVIGSAMTGERRAEEALQAAFWAATLGLPLFSALALAAERAGSRRLAIVTGLIGVAALAAIAVAWMQWPDPVRTRRYAQLSIGFHLLVAFLPWLDGRESNGFWQYNRALFLRFLAAALHSAVLFAGLAGALLALDKLFGLKIHGTAYFRLWLLVAFVFNTWFFLGGVPENLGTLEHRRDYPRALKVFSQFILIPIVAVYLAILTAYLIRVLVTGQWPSNWIGYLVSSVATTGILSLLLIQPLRDDEGHRWVGRYARWFYLGLLPAVGMLLAAISKRIGQYGVTEDRYFIAVLAAWLAAISCVFLLRHRTGVRWIPITLCALAFATIAGPLGAYGVSRRSQTARLGRMLEANGVLAGGAVVPASGTLPHQTRKDMSSVILYLLETHGEAPLREVLGGAMPDLPPDTTRWQRHGGRSENARKVAAALGFTYVERWESVQTESFSYNGYRTVTRAVPVRGAEYHLRLEGAMPAVLEVGDEKWRLEDLRGAIAVVTPRDTLRFPLDTLIAFSRTFVAGPDAPDAPHLTRESSGVRATLAPYSYSGFAKGDSVILYQMTGDLYVTVRR